MASLNSWKITKIDNVSHKLTVKHEDGDELSIEIPLEHRKDHASKAAYIKMHTDARDKIKANSAVIKNIVGNIDVNAAAQEIQDTLQALKVSQARDSKRIMMLAASVILLLVYIALKGH